MAEFIPGRELARLFYWEAVRPMLDRLFPSLPHAAGHLGEGSDVLGFDTEMSRDHDWGPSGVLLLRDEDVALCEQIHELLRHELPRTFYDYATGFVEAPDDPGTMIASTESEGPLEHKVRVTTVRRFAQQQLAYDIDKQPDAADWLTFPPQRLRTLTTGAVFFDSVRELTALRERMAYYPHDVWLYLLAAGWTRIGQEEHLMPRAGYVSDELGSALIGARLVRDIMNLCFLMERQYAPYPKWFGTAFKQLRSATDLIPTLHQAQLAATWSEREAALVVAYEYIAAMHNALGLTQSLSPQVTNFFGRPFRVLFSERFASALVARITDPTVLRLTTRRLIGSIDQWSDSTDILSEPSWREKLRGMYV